MTSRTSFPSVPGFSEEAVPLSVGLQSPKDTVAPLITPSYESGHRRFQALGLQESGHMFDAWMIRREPGRLNLTSLDKQLSAYDVLALARAAATAVAKRQEVVAEAGVDPLSYPIMRDITFLDPSDVTNKQDILCRKGCIIYGLKFARALVLEDVAYIFPDEGFDGEKQIIDGVLHAADPLLVEDSFEYVILSALFSVVVQSFTSQITKHKAAFKVANTMGDNLDMDFEQNSARLREAEQYQVEIDAAMQAVDLHDRGAQGMVISIDPYMKGPKEGEQVKNPRFATEVQEIEELFEWCESTLESLKAACVIHLIRLRTEQEKIQQAMTQRRSRLLLIQILIQLVTMAFAFCSMISGFFGMNLSNGWCSPDGCEVLGTKNYGKPAFDTIVGLSMGVGFIMAWAFFVFGFAAIRRR